MRRRIPIHKRFRRRRKSTGAIFFIVILFVAGVFLVVALTGGKLPQRRLVRTTSRRTYRTPITVLDDRVSRPETYPKPPPFTPPKTESKRVSDDAEYREAQRQIEEGMRIYGSAGLGVEENQQLLRAAKEKFLKAAQLLESVNRRYPNEQAVEKTYQELMRYLHDVNKRLGVR